MLGAHAVNRYVADAIDQRTLPTLRNKAQALENYAATLGILFGYPDYSGWRSLADTTQLIQWRDEAVAAHGATAYYPVASYGSGFHGKGAAFDIKIVKWPAGRSSDWAYQQLGAYAPRIGLRWGGTFSGRNVDPYHFELAISIADAQALFDAWQKQQAQQRVAGAPTVGVLTPTTVTQPTLTFSNFQLPDSANALPKSLSEIGRIIGKPTGAIALGVVVALGLVVTGFFLILPAVVAALR
jgi:hypothetical protein